jgi:hypothetical protein
VCVEHKSAADAWPVKRGPEAVVPVCTAWLMRMAGLDCLVLHLALSAACPHFETTPFPTLSPPSHHPQPQAALGPSSKAAHQASLILSRCIMCVTAAGVLRHPCYALLSAHTSRPTHPASSCCRRGHTLSQTAFGRCCGPLAAAASAHCCRRRLLLLLLLLTASCCCCCCSQAVAGQAALHAACNQVHVLLASRGDAAATLGACGQGKRCEMCDKAAGEGGLQDSQLKVLPDRALS